MIIFVFVFIIIYIIITPLIHNTSQLSLIVIIKLLFKININL